MAYQSFRPFILALLYPIQSNAYIELPGTYRCADKICQAANRIISMKYRCTGGASDKLEASEIISNIRETPGQVFIMSHEDAVKSLGLQQTIRQADTAVVTSEENYLQACELFPPHRVFTYLQIKGLGYTTIILFHPFGDPYFAQLQKKLSSLDVGKTKAVNRPKQKNSPLSGDAVDDAVRCNEIVTAITRAKQTLYIISDYNNATGFYLESLGSLTSENSLIDEQKAAHTTHDGWINEIHSLIKNNFFEKAFGIYREYINKDATEEQFKQWLTPGSISATIEIGTGSIEESNASTDTTEALNSRSVGPAFRFFPRRNFLPQFLFNAYLYLFFLSKEDIPANNQLLDRTLMSQGVNAMFKAFKSKNTNLDKMFLQMTKAIGSEMDLGKWRNSEIKICFNRTKNKLLKKA